MNQIFTPSLTLIATQITPANQSFEKRAKYAAIVCVHGNAGSTASLQVEFVPEGRFDWQTPRVSYTWAGFEKLQCGGLSAIQVLAKIEQDLHWIITGTEVQEARAEAIEDQRKHWEAIEAKKAVGA